MSENAQQLEAINRFLEALKADDGLMAKFREAFPGFAEGLLDRDAELSEEQLEAVAGGLGLGVGPDYHCVARGVKTNLDT